MLQENKILKNGLLLGDGKETFEKKMFGNKKTIMENLKRKKIESQSLRDQYFLVRNVYYFYRQWQTNVRKPCGRLIPAPKDIRS